MIGMARPPPARPHIGLNPPSRFSSYASVEWAEDDAWDSASDSETTAQKTPHASKTIDSSKISFDSSSTVKQIPKPRKSPSSNSLTFSYTHVNAPSPSSYSPKPDHLHSHKTSWAMVNKSPNGSRQITDSDPGESDELHRNNEDFDFEDIDVNDTDAESSSTRPLRDRGAAVYVKGDAEDIVQGKLNNSRL